MLFFSVECRRKRAIANVTLRVPGTGKLSVNGEDIGYFKDVQQREQVSFDFKIIFFVLRHFYCYNLGFKLYNL